MSCWKSTVLVFQLTLPVWGATGYAQQILEEEAFQLTLPVWGATRINHVEHHLIHISTHAPRVGSDACLSDSPNHRPISTHAPRVGSDTRNGCPTKTLTKFQLTLPVWGATRGRRGVLCRRSISTHAPRVGSDLRRWRNHGRQPLDFNSRSPCGERPPSRPHGSCPRHFNSRSPWGERQADQPSEQK